MLAQTKASKVRRSVFEITGSKPRSRDLLVLRPILVKIAEGLLIALKRRRKSACLSRTADRQNEGNRCVAIRLCSGHDQHSLVCNSLLDKFPYGGDAGYRDDFLFRFVGAGDGSVGASAASATSLISRNARSRAMFWRTLIA